MNKPVRFLVGMMLLASACNFGSEQDAGSEAESRAAAVAQQSVVTDQNGGSDSDTSRLDFTSPEKTLDSYLEALRAGDRTRVALCFEPPANDYYLPEPAQIESYEVEELVVYGPAEVTEWNDVGIVPAARTGDVDLTVVQLLEGREFRFSYLMRAFDGKWKIISHSVWDF